MERTSNEIFANIFVDYNINPKEYAKAVATDSFICGIANYDSSKGHFVFEDTFALEK